jgi:integrase
LIINYLAATKDKRSHNKDCMRTKHLREMFAGREIQALQSTDIRAYVHRRKNLGISASTINRELALFSAAINFANREWDWQLPNPLKGKKLKEPEGRVRWITCEEADSLIAAARSEPKAPHLADFVILGLNTGCRSGELLGLDWRRIDLKADLIYLEAEHTKAGKRRSVPLNRQAREAVLNRKRFQQQFCPKSQWVFCDEVGSQIQSVRRSFATACRRVGIQDFHIHDLRHTCAAWLVSLGVPLTEVRDLLGHSTVKVTERYAHLAPENVRMAVARLDAVSRSGHAESCEG